MKQFMLIMCGIFLITTNILAEEPRTYRIGTIPWAGWAALQVAEEKGFWKDMGVDVKLEYFSDGNTMHDAIFTEQVDFAMNMIGTAIDWYFQVKPVTILAETNWSHGGDKLIIKKGVTLESLKGKPIGVYMKGVALSFFLQKYLQSHGMSVSEFNIVKINPKNLVDQFIVGRLSAIVIFDPLALKAESQGNGEVLVTSKDIAGSIPECLYTFSTSLEKIPEKDVVAILAGLALASDWISKNLNTREFYSILNDMVFRDDPDYPDDQLAQMISSVKIHNMEDLCVANKGQSGIFTYFESVNKMIEEGVITQKRIEALEIFNNYYMLSALKQLSYPCR